MSDLDRKQLFKQFQEAFPIESLKDMTLDKYTNLNKDDSFCFWLESRTHHLGSIWGGTSYKFGIYKYNKRPNENDSRITFDDNYAWYSKYGKTTPEEAFDVVRNTIVTIAEHASKGELEAIDKIDLLGDSIKWKIAFLYSSESLIPIYKRSMLETVAEEFGLENPKKMWNVLLANANDNRISNQEEYKQLLEGFRNGIESKIPVSSIYPKLSAVVYKGYSNSWNPDDFCKGISGYDDFDYKTYDVNDNEKLLVAIFAKEQRVEGVHVKDVKTLVWSYLVLFWDETKNLLYINSSDNGSKYKEVANHVIGCDKGNPDLICGIDVFKTFHNIKRTKLRNVGLKVYLGRDVRFRMHAGRDVEKALSNAELQNSEKAFVVGDGFENGEKTSIGASYKGRIWSLNGAGDILTFKSWCLEQGDKLTNKEIDGNQILLDTLIPKTVSHIPTSSVPFAIDWGASLWTELETHFTFNLLGIESHLYDTEIELAEHNPIQGDAIFFIVKNDVKRVEFKLELFENTNNDSNIYPDYRIIKITNGDAKIGYGRKEMDLSQFLYDNVPTIFFADGSSLCGTEYIQLKSRPAIYDKQRIVSWDWQGVNLSTESQGIAPNINTRSIQYRVIQELKNGDYDVIYDDDNSGEIADVITLKQTDSEIQIELYHLKYAHGGVVSGRISNFYEVCGQAQKSTNWKYKEPEEFVNHLLRREKKRSGTNEGSRIQKGCMDTLVRLLKLAKKKMPVSFKIFIVQPGASKENVSEEILTLLGVTEAFLKDRTGIDLGVIMS